MNLFISMRTRCVFAIALALVGLFPGVMRAQPYTLTTGAGDGDVTVGVDGYGAFGASPGPDSAVASFDPVGPPGPIADTVFESGIALRIGAIGPRAFLTSGTIGGSGALPKATVTGTPTTGNSSFFDPTAQLSFTLVQTIAPSFNGALRTGAILTQTYTITNTTAGPLTFELCRFVDTQRNIYSGGQFFAANGTEILYADESPINPLVVGISGIGGTPLASSRFEINSFPATRTDILTGLALNDTVLAGPPFNVTMGLRNVFTVAAGASAIYTTHTVWGSPPAANVIFPTAPPPVAPAAGVLYGVSTTTNKLYSITTTPTAGIGAGSLVGSLTAPMQSPGLSFRNGKLYAWDQVNTRLQQIDPATATTLATIDIGVAVPGLGGDMAFRSDGVGFLSQGLKFYKFDITVPNNTPLPDTSVPVSGLAFDAADKLFALRPNGSQFYTIDQTTGVGTPFLGPTGLAGGIGGACAFDGSGNLYAAVIDPSLATYLYKIDLATGAATLLGNIGVTQLTGLTFYRVVAPPAGGAVGGIGEGSFAGSLGPLITVNRPIGEGTFSFGARKFASIPILTGPKWDGVDNRKWHVLNVSHRQAFNQVDPGNSSGVGILGWMLMSTLALSLLAFLVAKYRPLE